MNANSFPLQKFSNPSLTASGEPRAQVHLSALRTLWFNTGTLCNITCVGCYIESSPRNDRLTYLSREEVGRFLAEGRRDHPQLSEIGFTGGEPFMNPEIAGILEDAASAGYRVLVLTNAMKPMALHRDSLLALKAKFGSQIALRVSLDHYTEHGHDSYRGSGTWPAALEGLTWLSANGFNIAVAARLLWKEGEAGLRAGFAKLFAEHSIRIDPLDPGQLVLFPELDSNTDVPEITEQCWSLLGKGPSSVMCASARMVEKRSGEQEPVVVSCTLLPYDTRFTVGRTLAQSLGPISLNHPHCAKFCVLGSASCSPRAA